MKKINLILITILFMFSCKDQENSQNNKIEKNEKQNTQNLDDLFNDLYKLIGNKDYPNIIKQMEQIVGKKGLMVLNNMQETLEGAFMFALYIDDYKTVEKLFKYNIDLNDTSKSLDNFPPYLIFASRFSNAEIVKFLLENGADINATDDKTSNALVNAIYENKIEVARVLLENGIDINYQDSDGFTPLMYACQNNNLETIKFLLENGADVSKANPEGFNPLMIAASNGYYDLFKLLLENGADYKITYNPKISDINILDFAIQGSNLDLVKYTIEKLNFDVNRKDKGGYNPILVASNLNKEGKLDIIKFLVSKGADVNSQLIQSYDATANGNGEEYTDENIEEELENIDQKSNENNEDIEQDIIYTPLLNVFNSEIDKRETIKFLVSQGADIFVKDPRFKISPLMMAVQMDDLKLVKLFHDKGLPLDEKYDTKETFISPIMFASQSGNLELIKYLIENKADVYEKYFPDKVNRNIFILACASNNLETIKYLYENYEFDINEKDKVGYTALHSAAQNPNMTLDIVEFLIKNGSDINAIAEDGGSPLIDAVANGNIKVVEFLIKNGANVNNKVIIPKVAIEDDPNTEINEEKREDIDYSVLDIAKQYKVTEIIKLLEDAGAKTLIKPEKKDS